MKLSNAWKPDVSSFNLRTRIYPGYLLPFLNSVIERPSKAPGSKGDSPSLRDHTRSACKSWKNLPLSSSRDRSARRKATIFPFRREFVFVEKWWRDVIESKVNAKGLLFLRGKAIAGIESSLLLRRQGGSRRGWKSWRVVSSVSESRRG